MNNDEIKRYDELNVDEKDVIDCFRQMKLMSDQAKFELFAYRLTDLLNKYESLLELRRETQALFFELLDKIDENQLTAIDVSYEKFGRNRQVEEDYINEEVNIIHEYKVGFDEALDMIYSGVAEQIIIAEENDRTGF